MSSVIRFAVVLFMVIAGCTESAFDPAIPDQIAILPGAATVRVGQSARLTATATSRARPVPLTGLSWSSNAPAVATVNSQGEVFAVSRGSVSVAATLAGGLSSSAMVTTVGVAAVVLTVPSAPMFVGTTAFVVVNVTVDPGVTPQPLTYTSSNPAVASISASGLLTALSPGQTTITVNCEGRTAAATVTVQQVPVASVSIIPSAPRLSVGGTQQLTAIALDAAGAQLTNRLVTWSSQNSTIASVSTGGIVTAVAPGSTLITANIEGRTASVGVVVDAASSSYQLAIINDLDVSIMILANGVSYGDVGPSSSRTLTFPGNVSSLAWINQKRRYSNGNPIPDDLGTIVVPVSRNLGTLRITNVIDGVRYFSPSVTQFIADTLSIAVVRQGRFDCLGWQRVSSPPAEFRWGYYALASDAEFRYYRGTECRAGARYWFWNASEISSLTQNPSGLAFFQARVIP